MLFFKTYLVFYTFSITSVHFLNCNYTRNFLHSWYTTCHITAFEIRWQPQEERLSPVQTDVVIRVCTFWMFLKILCKTSVTLHGNGRSKYYKFSWNVYVVWPNGFPFTCAVRLKNRNKHELVDGIICLTR